MHCLLPLFHLLTMLLSLGIIASIEFCTSFSLISKPIVSDRRTLKSKRLGHRFLIFCLNVVFFATS